MNRVCCLIFYALFLLSASCIRKSQEKTKNNSYFQLKEFFEKEARRLQSQQNRVLKVVVLNRQSESKTLIIDDWKKEFHPFIEADINKTAYAGKYKTDTIFTQSRVDKIRYTALDRELKIKLVEIAFDSLQDAERFFIRAETKNALYHSAQQLYYHKNRFLWIHGHQQIRWLSADTFRMEIKF